MPCDFGASLTGVTGFLRHSNLTSLGVCEILVLGNALLTSLWYSVLKPCSNASTQLTHNVTVTLPIGSRSFVGPNIARALLERSL